MSTTTLRLRVLPRFPARISGTNGIAAVRDGADLLVQNDFSDMIRVPAVNNPDKVFLLTWNSDLNSYAIMSFTDTFVAAIDTAGLMAVAVYDPDGHAADAFDRANHTGAQAIATVTGLQAALDAKLSLAGGAMTGGISGLPSINGAAIGGLHNLAYNGSFRVNQRVFAGGALAAGVYGHDRWKADAGGCSYTVAAGVATITAGTLVQIIPGNDVELTGTYTISWAGTATCTVNGVAATKGSNVALTAGSNVTLKFTGGSVGSVQLEYGTTASLFEHRPFALEMAICQPFYEKSYDYAVAQGSAVITGSKRDVALNVADFYTVGYMAFKVRKRASPTLSSWASATGTPGVLYDETGGANTGNSSISAISETAFQMRCGNSALTAGHVMSWHWAAEAEL